MPRPRLRHLAATIALLAAGAAVAGALAAVSAERDIVVQPNLFVNPPGLIDANNSPTLVRNPTSPNNVVVVNRIDRPMFDARLNWSADGGRTWATTRLPLPAGKDRPYAPHAAFGRDGTLYVTYVNLVGRGNVPQTLWMATSDDGGRSLSPPVRVAGKLAFQARLAVDIDGVVHVIWLQATEVGLLSLTGPAHIVTARSADGGATFSQPIPVSDPDRVRVGAASAVIDSAGDLVLLYMDFKDDVRDFGNLAGPPWPEPFALVVTRSTDGGRSFTPGREIESGVVPAKRFLVFLPEFPSLAAGPDSSLFAVWSDARNGDEDVFVRASDDGRSWGAAVRVNDNPVGDGTAQYLPRVSVSAGGRVDVLFLDRRRDAGDNRMTDAYLATSQDGARSFDNVRVSTDSFDARVGPQAAPHLQPDLGSQLALHSHDDGALAAWTDTRLGDLSTGRQDIVVTSIAIPDLSAATTWAVVAAALLVVSLTAFVAWRGARSRPMIRAEEPSSDELSR